MLEIWLVKIGMFCKYKIYNKSKNSSEIKGKECMFKPMCIDYIEIIFLYTRLKYLKMIKIGLFCLELVFLVTPRSVLRILPICG